MRAGRGALSGLALLLAATAAYADEPAPFRGQTPVIAVRMDRSHTPRAETLDVFALPGHGASPRYAVRRVDLLDGRQTVMQWADSTTCPGLIPRLKAISSVRVGFASPLDPHGLVVLDGTFISVRTKARAREPDAYGYLEAFGNFGPWVDWAEATEAALKPCWSGTEPAVTTGG